VTPTTPLIVDVVSDVVCPWCFIGKRKLESALAQFARTQPSVEANVRWHPFQLNPDLPAGGIPRAAYLAQKFGSARAAEVYARVERAGDAEGIAFRFDRIQTQPNTFDAHRLIAWAQTQRDAGDLVEKLFGAFFVEGRSICDVDELARLAAECGWHAEEAREMLASDALRDVVTDESREAVDAGIQGVPCFIFNGRIAVSGAQGAPVLLKAIATARGEVATGYPAPG
jgi:predicted DsbA family dithiol-disulfide isomerase